MSTGIHDTPAAQPSLEPQGGEPSPAPDNPALRLPTHLGVHIFRHLAPPDLAAAATACSAWRQLADQSEIWQAVYLRVWQHGEGFQEEEASGAWRGLARRRFLADRETLRLLARLAADEGAWRVNAAVQPLLERGLWFPNIRDVLERVMSGEETAGHAWFAATPRHLLCARRVHEDAFAAHRGRQLGLFGDKESDDPVQGALLVAELLHGPGHDVGWVPAALDALAEEVRRRMEARGIRGGIPALEVLNEVLLGPAAPAEEGGAGAPGLARGAAAPRAGGVGLAGDQANYYDARNSMLDLVLERGRGIPITLCLVHAAVARRAGLGVTLLNTPGHVINRFGEFGSPAERYVDCFHGEVWTRDQAEQFFVDAGGGVWILEALAALRAAPGSRAVVQRIMMNLQRILDSEHHPTGTLDGRDEAAGFLRRARNVLDLLLGGQ